MEQGVEAREWLGKTRLWSADAQGRKRQKHKGLQHLACRKLRMICIRRVVVVCVQERISEMNRSDILQYFLETYFGNDRGRLANATGYTGQQIDSWLDGEVQPQSGTLGYVIHCALAPEFKIISEYHPFDPNSNSTKRTEQIRSMLGNHVDKRGIYSFYDATANLIYIGKTDNNLLTEICQALNQKINSNFELRRWSVVRYLSAYYVGGSSSFDYPNHVESLMLRISRPRLNTNVGGLETLPR